ncbi:hypothetical protein [Tessaracoccus sp. ZS01]|uniref:hypothetical protein n=1 Tax=Tessaracoccus sp. ZS01 TaxID=1906324 RepID=UPI00096CAF85|nr:hypothetical protein [Tessaracoccus sp. ZS01]MCG6568594.1 hypothetical protein [Tessaracoccus sp. ZS01]OMG52263.1 hypothetical protein BJN44_13320 [Tessaracoccus sp. ZS01]
MGFLDKLGDLWQRESRTVVHGWIAQDDSTYGPEDEGRYYLSVSCADLGLRFDRQRLGERRPVLQSMVTWPSQDERIPVSTTLGPSSFTSLNNGDFAHLIHENVALTGDLPMNSDAISIVVGLMAAPGEGLLDLATEFLGDLASLTQVPQLTAAAPIATKIANGVDKLLGTDETIGLIALQMSIQADALREGYVVVTDWPTDEGSLDRLAIDGSRLMMHDGDDWVPARGFNYLVLDVQVTPSRPKRWRELTAIAGLAETALSQLATATSPEDVEAAGSAIQVAMSTVLFEPNLTVTDRDAAADQIQEMWDKAVTRRNAVLSEDATTQPDRGAADEAELDSGERVPGKQLDRVRLSSMVSAGDRVTSRLKMLRTEAR